VTFCDKCQAVRGSTAKTKPLANTHKRSQGHKRQKTDLEHFILISNGTVRPARVISMGIQSYRMFYESLIEQAHHKMFQNWNSVYLIYQILNNY
jgi:hypothetical protein